MSELQSRCPCGRRVRVLWSSPIDVNSRPLLLVCGYYPPSRCGFRQVIPDEAVTVRHPSGCTRQRCADIGCRPSPSCASGNHCVEDTADGFVLVRDAKQPDAKPEVFTTIEFANLT